MREIKGYLYKKKYLGGKTRFLKPDSDILANWWVDYQVNGKRMHLNLRTTDVLVAKERWADKKALLTTVSDEQKFLRRQVEDGENAKRKLLQLSGGGHMILVADVYDKYFAGKRRPAGTKERTLKGYECQFNRFKKWAPQTIKHMRDLSPDLCSIYISDLEGSGMNANTVNKHIGALSLIWKTVDHTWPNPWQGLHSTNTHKVLHYRRLTLKECRTLYEKASGEFRLLILLGFTTGQRLGDLVCLKWDQVDMDARTLTVTPAKTDRRKAATVVIPMAKQLEEELLKIPNSGKFVMPAIGGRYAMNAPRISKFITKLMEDNKIMDNVDGKAAFHSLRHTFSSMLTDSGASLQIQATLTTHSLPGVEGTYTHPDIKVLRKWVDKAIPRL